MDLTTLARVKAYVETTGSTPDAFLGTLITDYSAEFETYMGRHAEAVSRTETIELTPFRKLIHLKGFPITSLTSVKYASNRDFSGVVALTEHTQFVQDTDDGTIRLLLGTSLDPGYVEVIYTGGMASNTTAFIAAFPMIAAACDQQVAYHYQRSRTAVGLGGSVTTVGGAATFSDELKLLKSVKRTLDLQSRRFW